MYLPLRPPLYISVPLSPSLSPPLFQYIYISLPVNVYEYISFNTAMMYVHVLHDTWEHVVPERMIRWGGTMLWRRVATRETLYLTHKPITGAN